MLKAGDAESGAQVKRKGHADESAGPRRRNGPEWTRCNRAGGAAWDPSEGHYSLICVASKAKGPEHVRVMRRQDPRKRAMGAPLLGGRTRRQRWNLELLDEKPDNCRQPARDREDITDSAETNQNLTRRC